MSRKKWMFHVTQTKSFEFIPGMLVGTVLGLSYTFAPADRTWTVILVLLFITITVGRVDVDDKHEARPTK